MSLNKSIKLFSVLFISLLLIAGCKRHKSVQIVVCFGDSLTAYGPQGSKYPDWLSLLLPDCFIINKGINGDTLIGGRARFEQDVLKERPDVVIIALGANDFWLQKRDISELKADLEDMVRRAKDAGIEVVIASCFGGRDFWLEENVEFGPERFGFAISVAKMEQEVCAKYSCFYVPNMQIDIKPNGKEPYWADKWHPNKEGNKFVAKRIFPSLKKALKAARRK